jgi:uncharacterized protein YcgL (UPF0745 family)
MFKTSNLTNTESISLSKEIAKVSPADTPLMTMLLAKGQTERANGKIHTWREKTLDTTEDITVPEGNENISFYETGRSELNNVLEIFQKGASVSGTMDAINVKGQGKVFAEEINDRLIEMKVRIENALVNGVRDDGSSSGIRKMDGILQFVDPANKVTGETANVITESEVKELAKRLWQQGVPSSEFYVLTNADLKEQIDELYKNSYRYVAQQNAFGLIVDTVRTNYGNLNFVLSRHVPADKLVAFDINYLALAFLRQPQFQALAKTGDSIKGMVLAELTLKAASKKAIAEYTLATE